MSEGQVAGASGAGATNTAVRVQGAIARAAQATGVDFRYLLAQAKLESSLDPTARASTSSATGLFQFTDGTWLQTLGRHAADHGMAWVQQAIAGGQMTDPGMRAQVMGLRYDADASAMMAAELASDNKAGLTAQLGREPDATELYLAHFLGVGGANQFLSALSADPSQSAASILPRAAAANPTIFYSGGGARSLGDVMSLMRGKVSTAMGGADGLPSIDMLASSASPRIAYESVAQQPEMPMGPVARAFHRRAGDAPQAAQSGGGGTMAEALQSMFNTTGTAAPANVRAAYARLAGLGL
ncbi:lytic transglycosylase domain-containing protein [Novosphingobium sp. BL-8A]|uniref:lytic transglycosylase domain-containing protein n=1 Tax=Novosphingobium sp. BL-8A TaxID=3127639 RepID=UPI003756F7DE